ncbi:hypothetical protein AVEN_42912-1 [Araneus ventricosus]|uniref:Uncharacterized protein n=1 Tax=Araneus ventricosus TaxID=182803 RepID=A0A4Y2AF91_ARAVE|nr:hypothetical protein AVEN_42912-1 [Araneus ventricosus]
MLEEWQTSWNNGDTGRKIYNYIPSVSLSPANCIREDVIFSENGPLPAYFIRFHLSDSDRCSCGGTGTALHCAMECDPRSVLAYEEARVKLRTRMAEKSRL